MVRDGRTREDDWYFDCIFDKHEWLDKEGFRKAMDQYYKTRGWDVETGIPTREKLEELDLKDVADELESCKR